MTDDMILKPSDITDSSEYSNTKYMILDIFLKNYLEVVTTCLRKFCMCIKA